MKPHLVIFCGDDPIVTFEIEKDLSKKEAQGFCGQINHGLRELGVYEKVNAHIIRHDFPNGLFVNDLISRKRIAKSREK